MNPWSTYAVLATLWILTVLALLILIGYATVSSALRRRRMVRDRRRRRR